MNNSVFPNILFITLDNVRADKFNSSSSIKTPNLDKLIENGIFFEQAISGSDGTIISLSNIFTGNYSIKTGIKTYHFDKHIHTFFDDLQNNGYYTVCCIPDILFLKQISSKFDDSIVYSYVNRDSYLTLFGGIGDKIVEKLKSVPNEPWIFYMHLMDAKPPVIIPKEFDDAKYGKTKSDRIISAIDYWIGQIMHEIDVTKTIVVVSSDHGNFIPFNEKGLNSMPTFIQNQINKIKKFSFFQKNGIMFYLILRKFIGLNNRRKLKNLDKILMRSFETRTKTQLFDELIRIPLLFSGFGINPNRITALVRQVDIFPTLFDLIGLSFSKNCNGRKLLPLLNGKKLEEVPAFIENAVLIEHNSKMSKKEGSLIGIRTSMWKYQRSRYDKNSNVSLYNVMDDPYELKNLSESHHDKIIEMEEQLHSILTDSSEKNKIRSILNSKKFLK